jgi:hypothetical protein
MDINALGRPWRIGCVEELFTHVSAKDAVATFQGRLPDWEESDRCASWYKSVLVATR